MREMEKLATLENIMEEDDWQGGGNEKANFCIFYDQTLYSSPTHSLII